MLVFLKRLICALGMLGDLVRYAEGNQTKKIIHQELTGWNESTQRNETKIQVGFLVGFDFQTQHPTSDAFIVQAI